MGIEWENEQKAMKSLMFFICKCCAYHVLRLKSLKSISLNFHFLQPASSMDFPNSDMSWMWLRSFTSIHVSGGAKWPHINSSCHSSWAHNCVDLEGSKHWWIFASKLRIAPCLTCSTHATCRAREKIMKWHREKWSITKSIASIDAANREKRCGKGGPNNSLAFKIGEKSVKGQFYLDPHSPKINFTHISFTYFPIFFIGMNRILKNNFSACLADNPPSRFHQLHQANE